MMMIGNLHHRVATSSLWRRLLCIKDTIHGFDSQRPPHSNNQLKLRFPTIFRTIQEELQGPPAPPQNTSLLEQAPILTGAGPEST